MGLRAQTRLVLPGDHNDVRPPSFHESASSFLQGALTVPTGMPLDASRLPRAEDGHIASIEELFDKLKLMEARSHVHAHAPATAMPRAHHARATHAP